MSDSEIDVKNNLILMIIYGYLMPIKWQDKDFYLRAQELFSIEITDEAISSIQEAIKKITQFDIINATTKKSKLIPVNSAVTKILELYSKHHPNYLEMTLENLQTTVSKRLKLKLVIRSDNNVVQILDHGLIPINLIFTSHENTVSGTYSYGSKLFSIMKFDVKPTGEPLELSLRQLLFNKCSITTDEPTKYSTELHNTLKKHSKIPDALIYEVMREDPKSFNIPDNDGNVILHSVLQKMVNTQTVISDQGLLKLVYYTTRKSILAKNNNNHNILNQIPLLTQLPRDVIRLIMSKLYTQDKIEEYTRGVEVKNGMITFPALLSTTWHSIAYQIFTPGTSETDNIIRTYLNNHRDIKIEDIKISGNHLLHYASKLSNKLLVKLLMEEYNFNILLQNLEGKDSVNIATHPYIMRFINGYSNELIHSNVEAQIINNFIKHNQYLDQNIMSLLTDKDIMLHNKDIVKQIDTKCGYNIFHALALLPQDQQYSVDLLNMIYKLWYPNNDVQLHNVITDEGYNPLYFAILSCNIPFIEFWHERHFYMMNCDFNEEIPLYYFAKSNVPKEQLQKTFDIVLQYINSEHDNIINDLSKFYNSNGENLLHYAVRYTNIDMVQMLMQHPLVWTQIAKDNNKNTLYHILAANNNKLSQALYEFLSHTIPGNQLVNTQNSQLNTPMQVAIKNHNLLFIELFVNQFGIAIQLDIVDLNKQTCLHNFMFEYIKHLQHELEYDESNHQEQPEYKSLNYIHTLRNMLQKSTKDHSSRHKLFNSTFQYAAKNANKDIYMSALELFENDVMSITKLCVLIQDQEFRADLELVLRFLAPFLLYTTQTIQYPVARPDGVEEMAASFPALFLMLEDDRLDRKAILKIVYNALPYIDDLFHEYDFLGRNLLHVLISNNMMDTAIDYIKSDPKLLEQYTVKTLYTERYKLPSLSILDYILLTNNDPTPILEFAQQHNKQIRYSFVRQHGPILNTKYAKYNAVFVLDSDQTLTALDEQSIVINYPKVLSYIHHIVNKKNIFYGASINTEIKLLQEYYDVHNENLLNDNTVKTKNWYLDKKKEFLITYSSSAEDLTFTLNTYKKLVEHQQARMPLIIIHLLPAHAVAMVMFYINQEYIIYYRDSNALLTLNDVSELPEQIVNALVECGLTQSLTVLFEKQQQRKENCGLYALVNAKAICDALVPLLKNPVSTSYKEWPAYIIKKLQDESIKTSVALLEDQYNKIMNPTQELLENVPRSAHLVNTNTNSIIQTQDIIATTELTNSNVKILLTKSSKFREMFIMLDPDNNAKIDYANSAMIINHTQLNKQLPIQIKLFQDGFESIAISAQDIIPTLTFFINTDNYWTALIITIHEGEYHAYFIDTFRATSDNAISAILGKSGIKKEYIHVLDIKYHGKDLYNSAILVIHDVLNVNIKLWFNDRNLDDLSSMQNPRLESDILDIRKELFHTLNAKVNPIGTLTVRANLVQNLISMINDSDSFKSCSTDEIITRIRNKRNICVEDESYQPLQDYMFPAHECEAVRLYFNIQYLFAMKLNANIDHLIKLHQHIGDILNTHNVRFINDVNYEKVKNYYTQVVKHMSGYRQYRMLGNVNDEFSKDNNNAWLFDNGEYSLLVSYYDHCYMLYSTDYNYKTVFKTKKNIPFNTVTKFAEAFFLLVSRSTHFNILVLYKNIPHEVLDHKFWNLEYLNSPLEINSYVEEIPTSIIQRLFYIDQKVPTADQMTQTFFHDNVNTITFRVDQLHKVLLSLQENELNKLVHLINQYNFASDDSHIQVFPEAEKELWHKYYEYTMHYFKQFNTITLDVLSELSWKALSQVLTPYALKMNINHPDMMYELQKLHDTTLSTLYSITKHAGNTLFFIPDLIRSLNARDPGPFATMLGMMMGDQAINSLLQVLYKTLPVEHAELISKLPITSPIFKLLTIHSIISLNKQLKDLDPSAIQYEVTSHHLSEQFVNVFGIVLEVFAPELATPLYTGLFVETVWYGGKEINTLHNLHIPILKAMLMSLGFYQNELSHLILSNNLFEKTFAALEAADQEHSIKIIRIPTVSTNTITNKDTVGSSRSEPTHVIRKHNTYIKFICHDMQMLYSLPFCQSNGVFPEEKYSNQMRWQKISKCIRSTMLYFHAVDFNSDNNGLSVSYYTKDRGGGVATIFDPALGDMYVTIESSLVVPIVITVIVQQESYIPAISSNITKSRFILYQENPTYCTARYIINKNSLYDIFDTGSQIAIIFQDSHNCIISGDASGNDSGNDNYISWANSHIHFLVPMEHIYLELHGCYVGDTLALRAKNDIIIINALGISKESQIVIYDQYVHFNITLLGQLSIKHSDTILMMSSAVSSHTFKPQYSHINTYMYDLKFNILVPNLKLSYNPDLHYKTIHFMHNDMRYTWSTVNKKKQFIVHDVNDNYFIKISEEYDMIQYSIGNITRGEFIHSDGNITLAEPYLLRKIYYQNHTIDFSNMKNDFLNVILPIESLQHLMLYSDNHDLIARSYIVLLFDNSILTTDKVHEFYHIVRDSKITINGIDYQKEGNKMCAQYKLDRMNTNNLLYFNPNKNQVQDIGICVNSTAKNYFDNIDNGHLDVTVLSPLTNIYFIDITLRVCEFMDPNITHTITDLSPMKAILNVQKFCPDDQIPRDKRDVKHSDINIDDTATIENALDIMESSSASINKSFIHDMINWFIHMFSTQSIEDTKELYFDNGDIKHKTSKSNNLLNPSTFNEFNNVNDFKEQVSTGCFLGNNYTAKQTFNNYQFPFWPLNGNDNLLLCEWAIRMFTGKKRDFKLKTKNILHNSIPTFWDDCTSEEQIINISKSAYSAQKHNVSNIDIPDSIPMLFGEIISENVHLN